MGAIVMAKLRGWQRKNEFTVLKDFKGLRDGVNAGAAAAAAAKVAKADEGESSGDEVARADCFLWEEFTTKPYHDSGEVKRVGQITTPWPAFMIAARTDVLEREPETLRAFMRALTKSCALFTQDKDAAVQYVVDHYGNLPEDASTWFDRLRYSPDHAVSRRVLTECGATLVEADVLKPDMIEGDIVAKVTQPDFTKLTA